MELCDGTKVYLNSGTTLEFPSRFDGKVRSVILKERHILMCGKM